MACEDEQVFDRLLRTEGLPRVTRFTRNARLEEDAVRYPQGCNTSKTVIIIIIIINKFICNSTELDSHTVGAYWLQAYKIQGNKMRRYVIRNVGLIYTNNMFTTTERSYSHERMIFVMNACQHIVLSSHRFFAFSFRPTISTRI